MSIGKGIGREAPEIPPSPKLGEGTGVGAGEI